MLGLQPVLPAHKPLLSGFSHTAHSMQHYSCCQITSSAVSSKPMNMIKYKQTEVECLQVSVENVPIDVRFCEIKAQVT